MKNNIVQVEQKKCFGCRSCEQRCPQSCITMQESEEGFLYPAVDGSRCINCGICVKHCPALGVGTKETSRYICKVCWLKDEKKLFESTSGGVFAGIAEQVVEAGGVVFGAAYDENLCVRQTAADTVEALGALKGSKYVESDTGDTFARTKKLLESGRTVFYTGTPCQIAGLKAYLGREYDNLVTADLICHGVPSRKLFEKYLEWKGKKTGGKIIYVGFRDKDVGGCSCLDGKIKIKTKTKTKTLSSLLDPYYASFIRCETYKESCYTCPFAPLQNRYADITIGDFHELRRIPEYRDKPFDMEKGVSLAVFHTDKGIRYFEKIRQKFECFDVHAEDFIDIKSNVRVPSARPAVRDTVYRRIDILPVKEFFKRFKEANCFYPLYFYSRRLLAKLIPQPVKNRLKELLKK